MVSCLYCALMVCFICSANLIFINFNILIVGAIIFINCKYIFNNYYLKNYL